MIHSKTIHIGQLYVKYIITLHKVYTKLDPHHLTIHKLYSLIHSKLTIRSSYITYINEKNEKLSHLKSEDFFFKFHKSREVNHYVLLNHSLIVYNFENNFFTTSVSFFPLPLRFPDLQKI